LQRNCLQIIILCFMFKLVVSTYFFFPCVLLYSLIIMSF